MVEPYLVVCGTLLLGSVLARALPVTRRSLDEDYEDGWDLTPRELAYLRRGPYGVVVTVLADLHGLGSVDLGPGRVVQLDPRHDLDDRLAVAVYAGLVWFRHPRLLALLPRVRRACAPLRWDLRERGLLPPVRRRVFAAALLVYAAGLAIGTALENGARGSTVAGALAVCGATALLAVGPRRTVAGSRELRAHRQALHRAAADGVGEVEYVADMVAAYGIAGVRELCGLIPAGALAPPAPSYEPCLPLGAPARGPGPRPVVEPAPTFRPRVPVPAGDQPLLVPVAPPVVVEFPVARPRRPIELVAA